VRCQTGALLQHHGGLWASVFVLHGDHGGLAPKVVEPYGNTKLLGETTALDVAKRTGLHTTIIRPVAIFGPGEHTPFGRQLRNAAFSKLLLAGGFQGRGFNYVHVEDVAASGHPPHGAQSAQRRSLQCLCQRPDRI